MLIKFFGQTLDLIDDDLSETDDEVDDADDEVDDEEHHRKHRYHRF